MNETPSRTMFQTSAETIALKRRFAKMSIGDIIEDTELERIIGGSIKVKAYVVRSAIGQIQRESNIVIERVRGKGVKRLSDAEIVGTYSDCRSRIRRMAKRGAQKLTAADVAKLTDTQRSEMHLGQAFLGFIAFLGQEKQQTKLLERAKVGPLEIGDTMKLFSNGHSK